MISYFLQGMVASYLGKEAEDVPTELSEAMKEVWNDGWCDYQLMCEQLAREEKPNVFVETLSRICGNEGLTLADLGV